MDFITLFSGKTRIEKCYFLLLSLPPSLPIITHNAGNILEFLFNSPPPHLESTKTWGAQELSIRPRLAGLRPGPRPNLLPLGPCCLMEILEPLRCCCGCGFRLPEFSYSAWCCRYHTPVPALETDMLKLGDTLSTWGLWVTAKGLALLF